MATISSSFLGTQIFASPPRPKTVPKNFLVRQAFVNRERSKNVQNHEASDANYISAMESNTQAPLMSTSSRPLANFQPSVWGDWFLHLHESNQNNHVRQEDEMVDRLKEEVKWMLKKSTSNDYMEQLEFVNSIQRLGIAYHFGEEIDHLLHDVFEKFEDNCKSNLNLHMVGLSFRLLRQHGYRVSSEIFLAIRLIFVRLQNGRWWQDLDVGTNFPYARDRLPLSYLWGMLLYFEPEYASGRIILCKVFALLSLVDDTFDAYGTFEELKLFNEAIERWDISCLDQLPDYMKLLYNELLGVFGEIEEKMTKLGVLYWYTHVKEGVKYLLRDYFYEVEWRHKNLIPTIDEYMSIAEGTSGCILIIAVAFVAMGNLATEEAFEWLFSKPDIMRALMILARLKDDLASHEFDKNREHIPSAVECYIVEHKVGEKEAIDELNNRIEAKWKDINNAFLRPTEVPVPLLDRCVNVARIMEIFYSKGDLYTHVGPETKAIVNQTLVDPIPE